jgi:hypothetical protein
MPPSMAEAENTEQDQAPVSERQYKQMRPKELLRPMQLKLIIPRDDGKYARRLRDDLRFTSETFTEAVRAWERILLELRQDDVMLAGAADDGAEALVPGEVWRADLIKRVGRKALALSVEEMRTFYGLIIASYTLPGAGSAQKAMTWYEPLITAGSLGGKRRFEILEHFGWLPAKCLPKPEEKKKGTKEEKKLPRVPVETRALIRIYLKDTPEALKSGGRPSKWVISRSENSPDWYEELLADVEEKQKDLAGSWGVRAKLEAAGLLPLVSPLMPVMGARGKAWEKAAFNLAAGHLCNWETAHFKMIASYEEAEDKLEAHEEKGPAYADVIERLAARYPTLTRREVRGWRAKKGQGLYDWLRKNPTATVAQRSERLVELQKKAPWKVGSPEVLGWLMAPEQQEFASHPTGDPVMWLADLTALRLRLEVMRQYPTFTFAGEGPSGDAETNGKVLLDGPTSTNNPQYRLVAEENRLFVVLPLLWRDASGMLRQETHRVLLAPSKRLRQLTLTSEGGDTRVSFLSQDGIDRMDARLGGGFLFVRGKRAYLQATMRIPPLPVGQSLISYWSSGLDKRRTKEPPADGTLFMHTNLGMRNAVGCTVLRWRGEGVPTEHVRSFLLRLPGDCPDARERQRRWLETRQLREMRKQVNDLADQRREIDKVEPGEERDALLQAFLLAETEVGKALGIFRRKTMRAATRGLKSSWRVQYLEDVRRLLVAWDRHTHPGTSDAGGRTSWKQMTTGIASRLGEHILGLKQDRVRTTADMIVQAARGRVRVRRQGKMCWIVSATHEPVQAIIVDGIHSYRTRIKLPPGENRQLARWCHRAIAESVKQQAEVAGIAVGEGYALSTSSFLSRTRAPGVRCHALTKFELEGLKKSKEARGRLVDETAWTEQDVDALTSGALVPMDGGETLVSLAAEGAAGEEPTTAYADAEINAAQNIGTWYAEGFANPVSLPCVEVAKGREQLAVDLLASGRTRLHGAFYTRASRADALLLRRVEGTEDVYRMEKTFSQKPREKAMDALGAYCDVVAVTDVWHTLYRDLSGMFWPKDVWVIGATFWDEVERRVYERLLDVEKARAARKA